MANHFIQLSLKVPGKKVNAKPHNYKMFSCERNTTLLIFMMESSH